MRRTSVLRRLQLRPDSGQAALPLSQVCLWMDRGTTVNAVTVSPGLAGFDVPPRKTASRWAGACPYLVLNRFNPEAEDILRLQ
jgi:hypothetical protein